MKTQGKFLPPSAAPSVFLGMEVGAVTGVGLYYLRLRVAEFFERKTSAIAQML